jgi:hypothetical protein
MKWKHPPIIKIYEALGAIADERIEVSSNTAKVYSSSGNKFYDVSYDSETNSIMANDNGSYWKGYLGYPAIAYLFKIGTLDYKPEFGELLKGIAWKDINQKFKNDFDKTLTHILSSLSEKQTENLNSYARGLEKDIERLNLGILGTKRLPPDGY